MKTILITGIGGLTPRSIATIIREKHTGVMAHVGFDLIEDTIKIMEDGNCDNVERAPYYHYDKPYVFLRDVDVEPIILESEEVFDSICEKQ